MKTTVITLAIALALGVAGCDRNQNAPKQQPAGTGTTSAPTTPQSNTPSTPANVGTPSQGEKTPPVQGREDVREPAQQKDFQHKGDGAGPKPGG
jgi:hypothetical protein